ncbi:MAG: hypothetical protein EAS48_09845 [Chryseobacterium sp.]|nr:MAG: hypothetical protein EAS48_09845 [Chryseobacterium sp.]
MMKTIFRPHVGKRFGESPLGTLLILGDSHYDFGVEQDAAAHTGEVVSNDEWVQARFFKNVAKLFGKNDFTQLRDFVAFGNAVQQFMTLPTQRPTTAEMDTAEDAIKEYIAETGATRMVVFSVRVWEHLFNKPKTWGRYLETLEANGRRATVWELESNGIRCHAIGFQHPSARGWSKDQWQPLLDEFLRKY